MHNLRPDTFSLDALLMVVIVFPLEFQGNEKLPKLGGIIQKVKYIEGSAHGAVCLFSIVAPVSSLQNQVSVERKTQPPPGTLR